MQKWTDMFTLNDYPVIKDGEGLAKAANSVLETYKANGAIVVRTNSVPRTATKAAEHLIVTLFARTDFTEAAFARFLMKKGAGASMVYSHRIYGKGTADKMGEWLTKNGDKIEKALMSMSPVSRPSAK